MRLLFYPVVLLLLASSALSQEAGRPKAILLIGHAKDSHPRLTHEYLPVCELLAKCLRQTPQVRTVVAQDWPQDQSAQSVDAIVLYVPWGANTLFAGPQRIAVKKLLDAGAGLVAIHWSTGAEGAEFGQLWLDELGEWFHTDFSTIEHRQCDLKRADPSHPVLRGVGDFNMFDEYYFNLRFADEVHPLIRVEHNGKPQTIAWTYQRPHSQDGRSFGCVAGHYHKNFGNDQFRRLLINAILWTAHLDIPAEGAPCEITDADLKLPPPVK